MPARVFLGMSLGSNNDARYVVVLQSYRMGCGVTARVLDEENCDTGFDFLRLPRGH